MRITIEFGRPALPRRRRSRLVVASVALALLVPATALAAHVFDDVPDSMSGHDAIAAVADARITVGCTATTYCPGAPVTREQMAIFLQRGLSRVTGAQDFSAGTLTGTDALQNEADLRIGGNAGGTQFVKADVAFTGFVADATGCPCDIIVYIAASNGENSEGTIATVSEQGYFSGATTFVFPAATGTVVSIGAFASSDPVGGEITIFTDISAMTGAFGGDGTDAQAEPASHQPRFR